MDIILEAIINIICWPYNTWKHSIENSSMGASEDDLKTLKIWKYLATTAVISIIVIYLIVF